MRGSKTPPLEVTTAHVERLDHERLSLALSGTWQDGAKTSDRLTLVVDAGGRDLRFPAVPRPRQVVGASAARFEARFNLPAALEAELTSRLMLLVGDTSIALPELDLERSPSPPPEPPEAGSDDPGLLAPLREELAQRAQVETRLRAELAALRARVGGRGPAAERLEAVRRELGDEIGRVREALQVHEQRRDEVESRAMVLAAELSEAEQQRELIAAELQTGREERDALRSRVAELEAEVAAVRQEASALRTAELSARAGREAALAEVAALHDELDRLASGGAVAEADAGELELQRAEALLAEARSLTDSLG